MLLAFDIGNTNIVVGCFEGSELVHELRLKTDALRTLDEYSALLHTLFATRFGGTYEFGSCIISSVVPPITPDIIALVENVYRLKPLLVGPGIKTGVGLKVQEPNAVGADRVVNAVAVKALFGTPALVVDFGTATTFDYVSAEGNYEGGVIAPGVAISAESLVRNTAKLPRVELTWPRSALGKNTVAQMQAGAVMGYGYMIDGLIDRFIEEVGPIPHIVATGGLGRLFAEKCRHLKRYDAHLTLKGMQIIAEMNR